MDKMKTRSKEWSEDIAKKLNKKSYRRNFFLTLVREESCSLREAIQIIATTMGNAEFSKLIQMTPSMTSRVVNPKNDIRTKTLEQILKKFGCELSAKGIC